MRDDCGHATDEYRPERSATSEAFRSSCPSGSCRALNT
ncbi:hypothetical protein EBESD8_22340 [Rhodococcus aetherivorans]|nr:hypothetical protein EBESD8_22340 [Rhodococcus aetherivorans]